MRRAILVLVLIIFAFLFPSPVYGYDDEGDEQKPGIEEMTEDQLKESGIEGLLPLVPEEGKKAINESDLLSGEITKWTPQGAFGFLFDALKDQISAPLRLFLTVCGILLLAALLEAFSEGMEKNGCSSAFSAAVTLSISAVLIANVTGSIRGAAKVISELSYFVLSFIPVFSGVVSVSGRPASAAVYQMVTFSSAQFFSQVAASIVVPLLGIFLAICTVGSISDAADVQGIAQGVKKAAGWVLTLCLTIFVGLLTLQSMVTGAADTVGNRTIKFVLSSAVPVVGGALSEAYGSLFGCLGVVKSTVGVFGIIVMAATFLPVILNLSLTMLALNLSGGVGELLGLKRASGVLKASSSSLSIMMGLILCYGMMILVSITVMLLMGTPG